jgi:DNA-binding Xre family transcriptional regulator
MYYENLEVRQMIADKKVFYYELADKMGISPYTLSIWLRHPLNKDQKQKVLDALASFD